MLYLCVCVFYWGKKIVVDPSYRFLNFYNIFVLENFINVLKMTQIIYISIYTRVCN